MPTFTYKAKDKKGNLTNGTMEADGRGAVVSRLRATGFFPMSVTQVTKKGAAVAAPAGSVSAKKKLTLPKVTKSESSGGGGFKFKRGVKASDIANFNRQLSDLLGAGIPLVKGLAILVKQTANEDLKAIVADVLDDVQSGTTFADALGKHPKTFSKLYTALVRAGEAGGMLDEILERLADFSEQEEQLKSKVFSALAYPVVMIVAGSGAIFVMFGYVIPKITTTFEKLGQALPAITQVLISISHFVQSYWYIVILALFVGSSSFIAFVKSSEGKKVWDDISLRIPVLGMIIRQREVSRFARTLGSLIKNGVNILQALEITKEVLNNTVFKADVDRVIEEITQGASIAQPLRQSPVFPSVAINMIAIGEETGRLPDVLIRISESYEIHTERALKTLTNLIEPLIIVTMGLVVGFVVIAMLLPIFSLDPSGGM